MRLCAAKCLGGEFLIRGIPKPFTNVKGQILGKSPELLRYAYVS
jgi:hypothetical protein